MTGTHTVLDHIFLGLIIAFAVLEWRWLWPRFLRTISSGIPGAQSRQYWVIIRSEWLFTLCILVAWAFYGRSWTSLSLGHAPLLRLSAGLAFVVLFCLFMIWQRRKLFAKPKAMEKLRAKLAFAEALLPHTAKERKVFMLLSVTAGVCEEIIFRGFVLWYFAVWVGPVWSAILSSAVFGFGHIYLSLAHVPRTALFGLFAALLVLATGSLWPAIIIHAFVDLNSGEIGYRVLNMPTRDQSDPGLAIAT